MLGMAGIIRVKIKTQALVVGKKEKEKSTDF